MRLSIVHFCLCIFAITLLIECKLSSTGSGDLANPERIGENNTTAKPVKNWYTDNEVSNTDRTYVANIRTVFLHKTGFELNEPVIALSSTESVTLRFDDLDGYLKDYSYTITHCNKNWEESGLTETEYIQGFFINSVKDYQISFNTFQKYINYAVTVPNEDVKILKSGNYLVKVFLTNDPDNIILTRRFMVYENKCEIKPIVKRPSDLNERYYKQEIDFSIIPIGLGTNNSYDIVLRQNSRWDNAKTGFSPVFFRDKEIIYDLDQPDIYNGANEFRFFDIRNSNYENERNISFRQTDSILEVQLSKDASRSHLKYLTNQDINGKYLVQNQNGSEDKHHSEADYVWVNFELAYDKPITNGTLYIFGALSNWDFLPEFRLNYNDSLHCYQKRVLLKQGYYNYEYVLLKDNVSEADETTLEGNHFETNNSYSIFVYFRDITDNYDRIIGYKPFQSIN